MREAVLKDKNYRDMIIFDMRPSSGKAILAEGRKPFLECTNTKILSRGFYGVPTGALLFDTKQSFINSNVSEVDVYSFIPQYEKLFTLTRTGSSKDWRLRSAGKGKRLFIEIRDGRILQVAREISGNPKGRIDHGRIDGLITPFAVVCAWYLHMGGLYFAGQRRAANPHFFGDNVKLYDLPAWQSDLEIEE